MKPCIIKRKCCNPIATMVTDPASVFLQDAAVNATFSIGKCSSYTPISVTLTVMINGDWKKVLSNKNVKTSGKGRFSLTIPAGTTDLRVDIKIRKCGTCTSTSLALSADVAPIQPILSSSRNLTFPVGQAFCLKPTPLSYLQGADLDLFTMIRHCCQNAIDASGFDHANAKEQLGPCKAARAICIVMVAMFEALNSIIHKYQSYKSLVAPVSGSASKEAAMAKATHDTLVVLFPAQTATFDAKLVQDLKQIKKGGAKSAGIAAGAAAAAAILADRANDNSNLSTPEPVVGVDYIVNPAPGNWDKDPISLVPIALGANWSQVTPFTLSSASQFRCPALPDMTGIDYANAFNEVKAIGGDPAHGTHTVRGPDAEFSAIYWAYDGTPSLCAPPRMYNQIAMHIATQEKQGPIEFAKLLAVLNIGLADAAIAAWESKYYYKFWRPVTAIRRAAEIANANISADTTFYPLGAPKTNSAGPNFTPPFPAYPSGHATFGGTLFQILRNTFGKDDIAFTFVSDEYNGATHDIEDTTRPMKPRTFITLSQAEEENGQSRMPLGIHYSFDKTEGITMGNSIADHVFGNVYVE